MEPGFWLWLILGFVLVGAEVMMPGAFLLWPGIAALLTGMVAYSMPGLGWQALAVLFAVLTVASALLGRRAYGHFRQPRPHAGRLHPPAVHPHPGRCRAFDPGRHHLDGERPRSAHRRAGAHRRGGRRRAEGGKDRGMTLRLHTALDLAPGPLTLGKDQSHYVANVMRAKPGEDVLLFNGRDGEWRGRFDTVAKSGVIVAIEEQTRPQAPEPDLWLLAAPIKKDNVDLVAEKAAELGASALWPVFTRRTVMSRVNTERLAAHMIEAAEQCERLTVPVVIVATEESLASIPKGIREGSLALGATKFQTLTKVLLPMATPGIMTGLVLSMARAVGEVAPLMMVGVVKLAPTLPFDGQFPFFHMDRKFMHLGFHIFDVGFQSPNVEAAKPMVYVTTLLLLLIVVVATSLAIRFRNQMRRKYTTSHF